MERFWAKVDKTASCWLWMGCRDKKGYGSFGIDHRTLKAHRVSYELTYGPIPNGLHVLHDCDTPACVNPAHLHLGTHTDNMREKVERGRDFQSSKTECINGHPFTAENTYITPLGRRNCKACRLIAKHVYRARLAQTRNA